MMNKWAMVFDEAQVRGNEEGVLAVKTDKTKEDIVVVILRKSKQRLSLKHSNI